MKRFLEDMAAAAALAQGGDHDEARSIVEELQRLAATPGARLIFVADEAALPARVARYVCNLARRLGSNLLVVVPQDSHAAKESAQPVLESLQTEAGDVTLSSFTAPGDGLELARRLCGQVRGVELVLVHASDVSGKAMRLRRQFKVPVYHVG